VTRKAAHRRLVDELLDFFGGSPRSLVAQFVEAGRLTLDDLREMEEMLAHVEAEKGKDPARGSGKVEDEGAAPAGRGGAGRERRRR
jgi:hypothetical protein